MEYVDLYNYADGLDTPFIGFEDLRNRINAVHPEIGRVDTIPIKNPEPTNSAFFLLAGSERTSAYDDEFVIAEIIYCSNLAHHPRERRYALTKELMHVFDTVDERASDRDRFISLMREVQNRPLPQHASAMYKSELDTRWMAAIVLCPKSRRDPIAEKYRNNEKILSEVAEHFRIPEWVASFVMDDYYDTAYESLVEGKNGGGATA